MAIQDTPGEEIKKLITRFLEGEASDQDVADLHHWLAESADNRLYFDEVNNAYQASVTLHRFNQQKVDHAWSRLSKRIDLPQSHEETTNVTSIRPFLFLKVAASICILVAAGFLLFGILKAESRSPRNVLVQNVTRSDKGIVLPDSSVVWLNANSTIEYPVSFDKSTREVILKGEAFFDIRKDVKPFIVKTENMNIQVKGTRFNVQAYKNDQTAKTTLEEGKVELHVTGEKNIYTLGPGDQAILNKTLSKVTLKKVDPANFTAWKEDKLIFDNTPLCDIISRLENRFHVAIEIDSTISQQERLTMTIENENLDEILDHIVLSSDLQVKKEKNKILLFK